MNKKEILCLILMGLGLIIMSIASFDGISIIASILNKLFALELPDVYFNSFMFRTIIVIIGGLFFITGGLIYKKFSK